MAKSLCLQIKKYGIFLNYWPLNALRKRFKIKNVPLIPRNLWSIRWMFLFSHKQKSQQFICHWVNVPLLTSTNIWKSHLRNVPLFTTTEIFKKQLKNIPLFAWLEILTSLLRIIPLFTTNEMFTKHLRNVHLFSSTETFTYGIRGTFHLLIHLKAKTSYIKFK